MKEEPYLNRSEFMDLLEKINAESEKTTVESTIQSRQTLTRAIKALVGNRVKIDRDAVIAMVHQLSEDHSSSYTKNVLKMMSAVFNRAVSSGSIAANPIRKIAVPKKAPCDKHATSPEEYRLLVDNLPQGDILRFVIVMAYNAGLACVDACRLLWSEVDMDGCMLRGKRHKSDIGWRVPFIKGDDVWMELDYWSGLSDELSDYPPNNPEKGVIYVCPRATLTYNNNRSTIALKMKRLLKSLGIEVPHGNLLHPMRRAFCTRLANSPSVNMMLAMQATGHKSVQTFRQYVQTSDTDLRESILSALGDRGAAGKRNIIIKKDT